MKKIAILGSTGSIGTQTLEVISHIKGQFKVELLSAYSNYNLLIEQAKKSDEFPEEFRKDSFKVHGCQSQVWLVPEQKEEKLLFLSDSDALISKGLVTLISSIYSNETAEEIANSDIDLMEEFELGVILSPARRNGAYSMLKTIKEYAKKLL